MAQTRKTARKGSNKAKATRTGARKTAAAAVADRDSARTVRKRTGAGKKAASGSARADEHPDVAMVRGLAEIVEAHSLSELIYDTPEVTLTLRRAQESPAAVAQHAMPVMAAPPAVAPSAPLTAASGPSQPTPQEPPAQDQHHIVTSPFVGTFYRRPNPEADPYVKPGERVEKGQVLCIVEAMKLMNEIEADATGTVVEILVEDANPVEYGQQLFKIATA
jgi:acetyl-CoA carboxylase biotin carboxyl carrier protein